MPKLTSTLTPVKIVFITRLKQIVSDCENNSRMSEYSQTEYEWIPCIKYKTDCIGLFCEILYECRFKTAQQIYNSIINFSKKHNHKIYPKDLPRICLTRSLYDYIQDSKIAKKYFMPILLSSSNLQLEKGDIIIWKYEDVKLTQTTSTGHLIIFCKHISANEIQVIECSSEKNGIAFNNFKYQVANQQLLILSHSKQKYIQAVVARIMC